MGTITIKALHGFIWSKNNISRGTKGRLFHSIVQNIVLCWAEIWPHTTKWRDKIREMGLDYMRRRLQLTRKDRVHNEIV